MSLATDSAARKAALIDMLDDFDVIYGVPLHGSTHRRRGKITTGRWHFVHTAMGCGYSRPEIAAVLGITHDNVYRLSMRHDLG